MSFLQDLSFAAAPLINESIIEQFLYHRWKVGPEARISGNCNLRFETTVARDIHAARIRCRLHSTLGNLILLQEARSPNDGCLLNIEGTRASIQDWCWSLMIPFDSLEGCTSISDWTKKAKSLYDSLFWDTGKPGGPYLGPFHLLSCFRRANLQNTNHRLWWRTILRDLIILLNQKAILEATFQTDEEILHACAALYFISCHKLPLGEDQRASEFASMKRFIQELDEDSKQDPSIFGGPPQFLSTSSLAPIAR
jgi:hypothetical protein